MGLKDIGVIFKLMNKQSDADGCFSAFAVIVIIAIFCLIAFTMGAWIEVVNEILGINFVWQFGWPIIQVVVSGESV